jgi:hypothetical protein
MILIIIFLIKIKILKGQWKMLKNSLNNKTVEFIIFISSVIFLFICHVINSLVQFFCIFYYCSWKMFKDNEECIKKKFLTKKYSLLGSLNCQWMYFCTSYLMLSFSVNMINKTFDLQ